MDTLQEFIVELRDELLEVGPMGDLRERVDAARALLVKEGVLKAAPAENAGGVKVSPGIRRGTISGTDPLAAYNPPVLGDRRTTRRSTSLRAGMVPFHIHRNAPFLRDVTLEAQHWVHFHRLCKYGHWHGTAHKAHDCEKCVKDCGGGAWSRAKLRDENNNLVRAERKRISSLLTQAMHIVLHRSRGNNPYKTFAASKAGVRDAMKIVYNVPTSSWRQRVTPVVLEEESFAQGAMRKCWRMIESPDEKPAPCVAKKYINGSDELAHWVDTKMQSVAKHYANLFSQHRACMHSVDFIEAYLIAIDGESPGEKPEVYSIEHFLEGKYVKYNNNSGYCLSHRNTPQAFSHFTWAQSNGELMVVDIQGVGDLYTDPQIHTWDGKGYGDGNLGLTGMSLFFNSHVCNYICKAMQLKPFEIYHGRPARRVDDHTRTPASVREQAAKAAGEAKKDIEAVAYDELHPTAILPTSLLLNGGALEESAAASTAYASPLSPRMTPATPMVDARPPKLPDLDDPNCFPEDQTVEPLDGLTDAPLDEKEANRGAIHMKLAELHAVGRFNDNVPDVEAAFYHLQMAAMYRNVNGLLGLARMHSGLPRDWIPELIEVPVHNDLTVILLLRAFEEGSKEAASALTSLCNGSFVAQNPKILVQCLTALDPDAQAPLKVVPEGKNDFGWSNFGLTEIQRLMMLAELYEKEKESLSAAIELYERAAEEAMAMGKGQQSTKLFMKVEELQALLPDEEEEEAA